MLPKPAEKLVRQFDEQFEQVIERCEELLSQSGVVDETTASTLGEMANAYRAMAENFTLHPIRFLNLELGLVRNNARLGWYALNRMLGREDSRVVEPYLDDRRFEAEDWRQHLAYDLLVQFYLIQSRGLEEWADQVDPLPGAGHEQIRFYARQLCNAVAPSNFLLTNPEALRLTWETRGRNLIDGVRQFREDLKRNPNNFNVSMTDRSAFQVGENLATTPGKVVFQNEMMQLIQYSPTTETVAQRPVLVVPPWINKYYILDLKPKNSLIRWLVSQGLTVFMISWVNPGPAHKDKGFDDYLQDGVLAAIDAIEKATGEKTINAIGYCIGGTLLATTLAWLAKKGRKPVASATYLTTLLDFSHPGGIGVYINPHTIDALCRHMDRKGYLDGRNIAFTFNLLRENDLFWSFWTRSYLKGEKPPAFDILYWNTDSTNLPAKMHCFYLREMYLHNRLVEPDALTIAGEPIDLSAIDLPAFFLSTRQDHIAKWHSTYLGAKVHGGDVRFVLAGSGHIAGVVNPPTKEKYGYWVNDHFEEDPDHWLEAAEQRPGSWWPHWLEWIGPHLGPQVAAREPGDGALEVIEDAPGSYVLKSAAEAGR
ncbi:class I poly(R)-hydroxyalkanoic acid synthase [Marinobacter sp. CHS3-4]|uniref:PHA/PHB synthase family protein n=1 Tax=Marinobacter sp. CHS3-4 TaxID=3045174 RepID=UPI0024B566C5|nr:class I poly(R)-hydroxyalkanoic acid synthase [Marinobacter sp. CHS3-4]MDI9246721.1 class I poly(R)-hydroxyalkanoic acid synthase [Marinobacter sp. CHS3-4]